MFCFKPHLFNELQKLLLLFYMNLGSKLNKWKGPKSRWWAQKKRDFVNLLPSFLSEKRLGKTYLMKLKNNNFERRLPLSVGGYAYIDSAFPRRPGDTARLRLRSPLRTDPPPRLGTSGTRPRSPSLSSSRPTWFSRPPSERPIVATLLSVRWLIGEDVELFLPNKCCVFISA